MRPVSVQVAPLGPTSVVAADSAGDLFPLEVRMDGLGVAAVKPGVGDADSHSFSRISHGVGCRDVHERGGPGDVVVYRKDRFFLYVHDGAQLGEFQSEIAGDLRSHKRSGLAYQLAFGGTVLFQELFHFPIGETGSQNNERRERRIFSGHRLGKGAGGLVRGDVLSRIKDLKLCFEILQRFPAGQDMVGVGRKIANDLNA